MTADVNVIEKAREAALARWALGSSDTTQMLMAVDDALAVLRSPEVVAGIAGVLRESLNIAGPLGHIFGRVVGDAADVLVAQESEVAARAVVDRLAGGGR